MIFKKIQILTTLLFIIIGLEVKGQDRVLLSGTLSKDIVILNRETKEIEWKYGAADGECDQCNSLLYLKGDRVVYTYKGGATMINTQGEVLWNFNVNSGEVLQSVSRAKGGLVLAISGTPMRIIEIDMDGNVKNDISYDTKIGNIYGQFRQIAVTKRGNYIIPIAPSCKVVELTPFGEVVKVVELEKSPLYVSTTKKGNWIVTCGHSGYIYEVDGKSYDKRVIVGDKVLNNGAVIEFGAGVVELKNGNLLLANWVGHNGDTSQPILIELTKDGDVVWQMDKIDGFTYAAGLDPISRN